MSMIRSMLKIVGHSLRTVAIGLGAMAMIAVGFAVADYTVTQGSGTTIFAFTCFTTKVCPAHVLTNSAGVEVSAAAGSPSAATALTVQGIGAGTPIGSNVNDGSGNAISSAAAGANRPLDVSVNDTSGNRLSGLTTGTFGSPSSQVISTQANDPCTYATKSSAAISVATATTTSLVAVSGTTVVYVCGFSMTIAPSATAAATALFEYGTSTNCTGTNALTGTFGNGDLTSAAGVAPITYGNGGYTIFKSAASNGICIVTAGTAVSVQGVLTYVQQ